MTTEQVTRAIERAILDRRGIDLVHVKDGGEETTRAVLPYWLTRDSKGRLYVQAYCSLRKDRRSFRLDRVVRCGVRSAQVEPATYKALGQPSGLLTKPLGVIVAHVRLDDRL
jgi:predicted DNA-binding transcriptional regulator YafY